MVLGSFVYICLSKPTCLLVSSPRRSMLIVVIATRLLSLSMAHERRVLGPRFRLQSAYEEKIPARNAIYAHAQDFAASDKLLLAILKAFIPQPLNKQQTIGFHVF
jgi:hypothetical protein